MTIDNAWDEKWSDWLEWGGGECPLDTEAECEVKFRLENISHVENKPETLDWDHRKSGGDIIAYRYKIKEGIDWPQPVSDMHEDLYWLARNVSEWNADKWKIAAVDKTWPDGECKRYVRWPQMVDPDSGYTRDQWQAARQQLGLDQPEVTPEEDEAWQAKERSISIKMDSDTKPYDVADQIKQQVDDQMIIKEARAILSKDKYSAYFKSVRHLDRIDVYRAVDLFGCEKHGHAISHAVKKLLLTGARTGGKDVETEVREAIDSLHRWLEMREEDARA